VRIFVIIAAVSCAYGQTAQLSGVVRDPSRAVVGGASIALRNDLTQVERVAVTNTKGVYEVPFLARGNYSVTVQAPGFRPLQRTGVKLDVAQTARLDFALRLTSVGESVSVTAGAPPLQSESSPHEDGAAGNGQITKASARVTIGGVNAPVSFSSLAPGFVGLYQVNAEVPSGLATGNQPVILSIGANSSNSVLLPVT
jgi:uncharacterized protein (TIGR03437 family)